MPAEASLLTGRARADSRACTRGAPPSTAVGCHGIVRDTPGRRGVSADDTRFFGDADSLGRCIRPGPDGTVMG